VTEIIQAQAVETRNPSGYMVPTKERSSSLIARPQVFKSIPASMALSLLTYPRLEVEAQ
jgi:hypothetical protein